MNSAYHKKGNISIVLLVALVVLLSGAAITILAVNSKYEAKASYQRIENRYIAESGLDMAVGLFMSYLSNQQYILTYTSLENSNYSVIDNYSPYLFDEIKNATTDNVRLDIVETESNAYLSSIGYLDFMRGNGVEISLSTFGDKEKFKLSQMCIGSSFLVSKNPEIGTSSRSKINPIYLTVKVNYKGGEVLCTAEVSGIYVVRKQFEQTEIGEMSSVEAYVDTKSAKVEYKTYQNYRLRGGTN